MDKWIKKSIELTLDGPITFVTTLHSFDNIGIITENTWGSLMFYPYSNILCIKLLDDED